MDGNLVNMIFLLLQFVIFIFSYFRFTDCIRHRSSVGSVGNEGTSDDQGDQQHRPEEK